MDRQQTTVPNSNYASSVSEWQNVKQDSILGPLLFLIYINDLTFTINRESKPNIFVDDTSILCCKTNFNELNTALKEILELIIVNFELNTNCVQFLLKLNAPININNNNGNIQINNTSTLKFLRLTTDSTLSWKEHIKHTASKLSSACYALRILSSILSPESLLMTYYSYVRSIMTYGIIFWGTSTHSDQIFKIQKRIG
jgi:hypothetical protein